MEGVPLKRIRKECDTDFTKCILCQKVTKQPPTSSEHGRNRILESAKIRDDEVYQRLNEGKAAYFVYHVSNECYKRYTLKKTLDKISEGKSRQDRDANNVAGSSETQDASSWRSTRAKAKPRRPPGMLIDCYRKECVVCGQIKYKGDFEKFRICEGDRAWKFLQATVYFQDEVYTRTCDLQDVQSVFGADLFCHKKCIRSYLVKYERASQTSGHQSQLSPKMKVFKDVVESIDSGLSRGEGYAISDLRDYANQIGDSRFTNREIKVLLCSHYRDSLCISNPHEANKSSMIFLNISRPEDMADTIRSTDPILSCANTIRQALLHAEFNLNDKFCDVHDLEHSWNNISLPLPLLKFFGHLFKFDPNHFGKSQSKNESDDDNDDDNDADENEKNPTTCVSEMKKRRMIALYQILYYNIHHGKQRTPLHIMNAQAIHETCKSSTLIKSFNHFGLMISYEELKRYHNNMASLIVKSAQGNVPLPSQFDPEMFTIGAFDNFDHEEATVSGIGGSHDTVSVLFQDKPHKCNTKPNISESGVIHGANGLRHELPCQKVREFVKSTRKPSVPETYVVSEELYAMDQTSHDEIKKKDFAWVVGRLDISESHVGRIKSSCDNQTMPSWDAFNSLISEEELEEKVVGFIPLIPNPVTEYATVYTALKNFQNILEQLRQSHIAITCDEGVYHIAREIMLQRPAEFQNIVLCMGSFHLIKVTLACIGKYLRGSGAENVWIESGIFGINVVESVLNGTNYARSLKGICLLAEAMERLQLTEYLNENGTDRYQNEFALLQKLKVLVAKQEQNGSQESLETFKQCSQMLSDFEKFKAERKTQNENFAFWDNFLQLVSVLKDVIRADREGLWTLHLHSVQRILPLFALFAQDVPPLVFPLPRGYENATNKCTRSIQCFPGWEICCEKDLREIQSCRS